MLLEGIHLPLTTPFHADGRLNGYKLEYNVDRYSRTPVAGLVMLSGSGEGPGLTDAETLEVLRVAGAAAAKEKVLLAEVGRESVAATLELVDAAAESGFDAVLVRVPASVAGLALERRTYFEAVADRAALPVVMVSVGEMSAAEIGGLARHPGIVGLVDGLGTAGFVAEVLAACAGASREVTVTTVFGAVTGRMLAATAGSWGGLVSAASLAGGTAVAEAPAVAGLKTRVKRVGFQVLVGRTAGMLEGFASGAVGAVPRFGACAPQACNEVFQAWKDGDEPLAAEKQARIAELGERMDAPGAVAAIKHGCDLNGYYGGVARLPLLRLTGEERAWVEQRMAGLRN